jgi:hypothetical protein
MKRFMISDSERKLGVEYVRCSKHSVRVLREAAKMLVLGDRDLAGLPHAYSTSAKRHGQAMLEAIESGIRPRTRIKQPERIPGTKRPGRGRMSRGPERAAVPKPASDGPNVPRMSRNRAGDRLRSDQRRA